MIIHCGGISTPYNSTGCLLTNLSHLPLPKDGHIVFPNGVANLISLAVLAKEFQVLYDSSVDDAFYVFHDNGTYIKFTKQKNGLYIYFVPTQDAKNPVEHNALVKIAEEKSKYSTLDCKRAEKARELQNCLCLPSIEDLIFAIENRIINDPGITRRNVCLANKILGPNKCSCKGKAVQHTIRNYNTELDTEVPPHILEDYKEVTLSADIFKVVNPC